MKIVWSSTAVLDQIQDHILFLCNYNWISWKIQTSYYNCLKNDEKVCWFKLTFGSCDMYESYGELQENVTKVEGKWERPLDITLNKFS